MVHRSPVVCLDFADESVLQLPNVAVISFRRTGENSNMDQICDYISIVLVRTHYTPTTHSICRNDTLMIFQGRHSHNSDDKPGHIRTTFLQFP